MSNGSVFTLIANDGKADRLIHATGLLKKRIQDITCAKQSRGYEDYLPTLVDIERTHILFVNAHYKPFAAHAFEYNKIPASGVPYFNSNLQFSIPQFGDFFCDMVLNLTIPSLSGTANVVPPAVNEVISNLVDLGNNVGTQTRTRVRYLDASGAEVQPGAAIVDFIRYCEYPGCRILDEVMFEINGSPIDQYTYRSYIFYMKFFVEDDDWGWKRAVGQEVSIDGKSFLTSVSSVGGATDTCKRMISVANGPQTPKAVQPALNMWIPLIFWFNLDPQNAIASVAIPYGQRFIKIKFAAASDVIGHGLGGLFRETTVINLIIDTSGPNAILSSTTSVTKVPIFGANAFPTDPYSTTTLLCDLYANNIFLLPMVHDIYIKRIGFSLVRVFRHADTIFNSTGDQSFLMANLKWPIEHICIGLQPSVNRDNETSITAAANKTANVEVPFLDSWHLMNIVTNLTTDISSRAVVPADISDITAAGTHVADSVVERITYKLQTDVINTLSITAHGIPLYQSLNRGFYSDYIPHHYGGHSLKTSKDRGVVFVTFCLYPGTYQPSGHINVSRAREFYLGFNTSFTGEYHIIYEGKGINFMLISEGNAVLRYST
jgi:hypothetical protein